MSKRKRFVKVVEWSFLEQGQYALCMLISLIVGFVWGFVFSVETDKEIIVFIGSVFSVFVFICIVFVFINVERSVCWEEV